MSSVYWVRGYAEPTVSSQQPAYLLATVPNGQTIRRTIIRQQVIWLSESSEEAYAGWAWPWGVVMGPSNVGPAIDPYTDYASLSPRWLWWDLITFEWSQLDTTLPTATAIFRSQDTVASIDTTIQEKNSTGSDAYLWYASHLDPAFIPGTTDTFFTVVGWSVLLEAP